MPEQSTPADVVMVIDPATLTPAQLEALRQNGAMFVTLRTA